MSARELPPHAAEEPCVAARTESSGERAPHSATVERRAGVGKLPHPAMVQRREGPFGVPCGCAPHPATVPRLVVQPEALQNRALHPATVQRRKAPFGVGPSLQNRAAIAQRASEQKDAKEVRVVFWNVYRLGEGTYEKVRDKVLTEMMFQMEFNNKDRRIPAFGLMCEVTSDSKTTVNQKNITISVQGKHGERGLGYAAFGFDFKPLDLVEYTPTRGFWEDAPEELSPPKGGTADLAKQLNRPIMQVRGTCIFVLHSNASNKSLKLVPWAARCLAYYNPKGFVLVGDLNCKDELDGIPDNYEAVYPKKPTIGTAYLDFAIMPKAWKGKVEGVTPRLQGVTASDHCDIVVTFTPSGEASSGFFPIASSSSSAASSSPPLGSTSASTTSTSTVSSPPSTATTSSSASS